MATEPNADGAHRRHPSRWRRSADRLARLAALALLLFGASPGCVTVVHPPAGVANPTPTFLVDYGYHASLVLPRDDGSLVEYAYGEWTWFAEGREDILHGLKVLLLTGPGTLGRRPLSGPADLPTVQSQVHCERVLEVPVDDDARRGFLHALDSRYEAALSEGSTDNYQMTFVHDAAEYSIGHQCNSQVADWLRELGCRVDGIAVFADFRVAR